MRRTSGRPDSAVSSGIVAPVSSSSGPMAGFCTITLNTGADRSGNTSRWSSVIHTAPSAVPATMRSTASSGLRNEPSITSAIGERSVGMGLAPLAARLVGLGLQEEGAVDHDLVARLETLQHLDLAAEL